MKYKNIITVVLIISLILLGKNNLDLKVQNERLNYSELQNSDLRKDLLEANINTLKYKNIFLKGENMASNIDYIYYDIPELTLKQQEYLQRLCNANNIAYTLILSMAKLESNFDSNSISETQDYGIYQINKNYHKFYAELAGLKKYNALDFYDNSKMAVAGLVYFREYWKSQGITSDEELFIYITNSYNCGINGYKTYIENNKILNRSYNQLIEKYKMQLEINGHF